MSEGQGWFTDGTMSPGAAKRFMEASDITVTGFSMSGRITRERTIGCPFQGGIFDPILPGDDRYRWSDFDYDVAAAVYQGGDILAYARWDPSGTILLGDQERP